MDKNAPIGIFDSGVGGMTVAREVMRQIPDERIVYFGDTARVPYGSKSSSTILRYTRQIIKFLMTKNVKAIVATILLILNFSFFFFEILFKIPKLHYEVIILPIR